MKLKKEYFKELIDYLISLNYLCLEYDEFYIFIPDKDEPELLYKIVERYYKVHPTPELKKIVDSF